MRLKKKYQKITIGYIDHLELPEFGINRIPCKIDTGAYTSTLHCSDVQLKQENGQTFLCFRLYDPKFGITNKSEFRFSEYQERKVRSSNGEVESRYSIKTIAVLFGRKYRIEFTLSFRDKMKFPILLGRRFLRKRFIVDVSKKDLSANLKTKDQ